MASFRRIVGEQRQRLGKTLRNAGLWPNREFISTAEREILASLFVPHYYARNAGQPTDKSPATLFRHFLAHGLANGISPTPLFEASVFREREGIPDSQHRDVPDLLRWCRNWPASGIVPTTRFDGVYYLHTYEEIAEAGIDPFDHFLRHGLAEGRRPNGIFDPEFYEGTARREPGEENLDSYVHYLIFGVERGAAPSAKLAPVLVRSEADRATGIAGYDRAVAAITPWIHAIGGEQVNMLLGLFHPYLYDGNGTMGVEALGLDRLVHFLETGLDAGIDPGPLFDSGFYGVGRESAKIRKGRTRQGAVTFPWRRCR